jgi:RNA polymerase sigma-70 factor (ECF subfamily)
MGVEPSEDSVSLVQQIAQGDREAFARFYDLYGSLIFTFAVRILRVQADAEDLAQEIFLSVWQKAGTYSRERGTPEAWLITMTRSRALDKVRAKRRRESRVTLLEEPEQLEQAAATERGSVTLGEQMAVQGVLAELPETQRTALQLAYFDGLTQSEIAARLGVPLGTVKTRIRDGLLRLRGMLEPEKGP